VLFLPLLLYYQELDVTASLKAFLTSKCQTAWEQISRLREVQFNLQLDINNKKDAVAIDKGNFEMTKDSVGTSYKPDPLRIPKKFV
jgi:tektin-2